MSITRLLWVLESLQSPAMYPGVRSDRITDRTLIKRNPKVHCKHGCRGANQYPGQAILNLCRYRLAGGVSILGGGFYLDLKRISALGAYGMYGDHDS